MITEIAYDEDQQRLNIKASGNASVEGFQDLNTRMVEHHAWRLGTKVLCDFRALDLSNINMQDAERSAGFFQSLGEKLKGAKIAAVMSKDIDYGVTRMWAALAESLYVPMEIEVFRSIDDAVEWLHS